MQTIKVIPPRVLYATPTKPTYTLMHLFASIVDMMAARHLHLHSDHPDAGLIYAAATAMKTPGDAACRLRHNL